MIAINFKFSDENLEKISNIANKLSKFLPLFLDSQLIMGCICFIFCILDSVSLLFFTLYYILYINYIITYLNTNIQNSKNLKFDLKCEILTSFFKKESMLNSNISNHKLVYTYLTFWINKLIKFVKADKWIKQDPSTHLTNHLFQQVITYLNYYIGLLLLIITIHPSSNPQPA